MSKPPITIEIPEGGAKRPPQTTASGGIEITSVDPQHPLPTPKPRPVSTTVTMNGHMTVADRPDFDPQLAPCDLRPGAVNYKGEFSKLEPDKQEALNRLVADARAYNNKHGTGKDDPFPTAAPTHITCEVSPPKGKGR